MRLSWVMLLLVSNTVLADGLVAIPSINEVPAFWGMLGNDPKYRDAAFKAQEAFFIQSGVTAKYGLVTGYVSDRVTTVAKKAENKTAAVIDNNTPLNSRYVFFGVAVGYMALVKKEITKGFRNPFFKNVQHTVTISQNSQSLGMQIPF